MNATAIDMAWAIGGATITLLLLGALLYWSRNEPRQPPPPPTADLHDDHSHHQS